tara:strand:+ start:348 stop:506 length:159 start_codon:yes stop_codon:yes gene_type:complete
MSKVFVVIDLPIAIVEDTITLGGELTDGESAIAKSCNNIGKNLNNAVKPDED